MNDLQWAELLTQCDRYLAAHGNLRVTARHRDHDDYPLGAALYRQRQRYRRGLLPPRRYEALSARGLVWEPDVLNGQTKWRHHLNQVAAFRRRHGTADVPQRYVDPIDGFALGKWLNHQRTAHRQGSLDPARLQALIDAGVTFDSTVLHQSGRANPAVHEAHLNRRADTWAKALSAASRAAAQGIDLNEVRVRVGTPDDPRLGRWLSLARRAHEVGALPTDVAASFEALGLRFGKPWRPRSRGMNQPGSKRRRWS